MHALCTYILNIVSLGAMRKEYEATDVEMQYYRLTNLNT